MPEMTGSIVWFRLDLRLADNPALLAAARCGGPVIPVFIWAPEEEGNWPPGAASCWWLHQSLRQLDASLRQLGSRLIIRRGPTLDAIRDLLQTTGSGAVFWNRRYEPAAIERDSRVKAFLQKGGWTAESFNGSLLFEPWTIHTQQSQPYQVFTPFWKACLPQPAPEPEEIEPTHLEVPRRWPATLKLAELGLEPTIDWAKGLQLWWCPGESGANELLVRFLDEALTDYADGRNRPDLRSTSRLSAHLHFGEINVRRIWSALHERLGGKHISQAPSAIRVFASELGWREFAHHLLFHFPQTPQQPLREHFARFRWRSDRDNLRMAARPDRLSDRRCWNAGAMAHRLDAQSRPHGRGLVSCEGLADPVAGSARWFWDTLVDADLANNTLGWQWTAGCGATPPPTSAFSTR